MAERDRQFATRVPEALYRRVKIAAARAGRPICALVEEALEDYLRRHESDG